MKKAASKARDEKLLAAVRERPVLYDQSMHVFKDFGAKNAAWKEVAVAVVGAQDKQAGRFAFYFLANFTFAWLYALIETKDGNN